MPQLSLQKQVLMSSTSRAKANQGLFSGRHVELGSPLAPFHSGASRMVLVPCSSAVGWLGAAAHHGQQHHPGVQPDSGSWEGLGLRTGRTRKMSVLWYCPPSIRTWDLAQKDVFWEWFGGSVLHALGNRQRERGEEREDDLYKRLHQSSELWLLKCHCHLMWVA